ncbi:MULTISPECIES: HalOD1 output domain-containing protein [Haloprofundus]|uniref:HalOD1 output domain-containing protein n=1 Tax=Haloprofundus TaxID=1911573 RepID=UPI0018E57F85|nr:MULTISPECIES: HalOD1 output domain-containing protein [Haloprofundus]
MNDDDIMSHETTDTRPTSKPVLRDGARVQYFSYDPTSDEWVTVAVVDAVAAAKGTDMSELPPLYESGLDPDALEELFDGETPWSFAFSYAGRSVLVEGDGTVCVENPN